MDKKQSLYDITEQLLSIFDQIEELEGELTPKLEEQLELTRENYNAKGEAYCKIIKQYENYITEIKEEKARLDKRKKVFENRVERLKKVLLEAINTFGPIETALFKIGTRKSNSIEIDENRITILNNAIINFAKDMYKNAVVEFGENIDLDGMIATINANIKADFEYIGRDDFKPYTVDDLRAIDIKISDNTNLLDLFGDDESMLKLVLENQQRFTIDSDTNKSKFKDYLEIMPEITVAEKVQNVSLSIR